jgi:uncharacterized alpha-E superfamily protein
MGRAALGSGVSVSMQAGAVSKDVWVTGQAPQSARPAVGSAVVQGIVRRSAHSLPSRTADNLYWLGRYFERVESKARTMRIAINALMDESAPDASGAIMLLFSSMMPAEELEGLFPAGSAGAGGGVDLSRCEAALSRWFSGEIAGGGVRDDILSVMRIARSVKERLSIETWNATSHLEEASRSLPPVFNPVIGDRTLQTLDSIVGVLSSICGLFTENMTRGDSWIFQDFGRRIERGLHLSNNVYSMLTPPSGRPEDVLQLLLLCGDSSITYRRRYFTALHPVSVIDLLLLDPCNPRSMAFQIKRSQEHLDALPHRQAGYEPLLPMDKTALRLHSQVGLADPWALEAQEPGGGATGERKALATFLDEIARGLGELSDQVGAHYFALTRRGASNPGSTAPTGPRF